jgi:hypothetical protein
MRPRSYFRTAWHGGAADLAHIALEKEKAQGPASPWARVSDFGGGAGTLLEGEDAAVGQANSERT